MLLLAPLERLIAASFMFWLGWLLLLNPDRVDAYDVVLGSITGFSIVAGFIQRKKAVNDVNERASYGKLWRLLVNLCGLVVAAIILLPKIPPTDISARLILWLFLINFSLDIFFRFKAWRGIVQQGR